MAPAHPHATSVAVYPALFVKNARELHIIKCIDIIVQEFFLEFDYLWNFCSYVVIEYYNREISYCISFQIRDFFFWIFKDFLRFFWNFLRFFDFFLKNYFI